MLRGKVRLEPVIVGHMQEHTDSQVERDRQDDGLRALGEVLVEQRVLLTQRAEGAKQVGRVTRVSLSQFQS